MSRLIDADKFLSQIEDQYMEHDITREKYMDLEDRIMQQPTIEERKTGKWIVTAEFEDCRYVKCNQCKVTQVFYHNKPLTNYCPNCGADMRDEEE